MPHGLTYPFPRTSILETMRGLDLVVEQSLGHYYQISIRTKLAKIFETAEAPKPAKGRTDPKP
jgi:hypothetical protein